MSSTLYNACLLAGLKIVERHNHNLAVAYVPLGQDATVAHGLKDFRFQNNLDDPIYLWTQAGSGKVTMKIYSNLKYKQKIQVTNVVDQVIDFKEIRETKKDLAPGTTKLEQNGSPGYVVRSFRTFYNDDGSVARQEQLARDHYRPLSRRVYVGPPAKPATPAEEFPGISEVPRILGFRGWPVGQGDTLSHRRRIVMVREAGTRGQVLVPHAAFVGRTHVFALGMRFSAVKKITRWGAFNSI